MHKSDVTCLLLFFNLPTTRSPDHSKHLASKFARYPIYFKNSCKLNILNSNTFEITKLQFIKLIFYY